MLPVDTAAASRASQSKAPPELPFVTIHYAQSLDGRIATRSGHSQWISGQPSLQLAHQLRAAHDAIMVGLGTVIADDPRLTVRLDQDGLPTPLRVVADSRLRLPAAARLLTDGAAPTLIATTGRAPADRARELQALGAEVMVTNEDACGRVDLWDLLRRLSERGVRSVLIEGGGALITSALRQRLARRLVICIAPKLIGSGVEAIGDLSVARLNEALTFAHVRFSLVGEDMIFDGRLARADT